MHHFPLLLLRVTLSLVFGLFLVSKEKVELRVTIAKSRIRSDFLACKSLKDFTLQTSKHET